MKNNLTHIAFALFLAITLVYVSCKKEESSAAPGKQQVKIYLTDGPAKFDAVYVDIQRIEVWTSPDSCRNKQEDDGDNHSGNHDDVEGDDDHNETSRCGKWDTLSIRAGIYNLLSLSNGTDTLLASGYTPSGAIKMVRITLGDNNSVVADSVHYPLSLYKNKKQVIIKAKGEDVDQINPGNLQLWLDFDAGRSIIKEYNNRFVLRPMINMFTPKRSASIEGRVLPSNADVIVSAIANGDTLVTFPRNDGYFKIRGIKSATADIFFNATANGYQDTTINAKDLHPGKENNIGIINLRK